MYTTIYSSTVYCYYPTNFGKDRRKQMDIYREFTVFENDMNWRKRKRLQSLETDDFRSSRFT